MSFSSILEDYPTSLEARIILYLSRHRAEINKISSELRASASPPSKALEGENSVEVLSNLESELRFQYKKKLPFCVCLSLAVTSWWLEEDGELGKIIRFLLEEQIDRFPHQGWKLQLALQSKGECLLWLQEEYYGHYEDIFSSLVTMKWSWVDPHTGGNISRTWTQIAPKYDWTQKKKPSRAQRKRGYRDHGSLGDPSLSARRQEWLKDYSSRLEEEKVLRNRRERISIFQLIRGWLQ